LESVQEIVGRAITEPEYRELLFADPDRALSGYDLTEEEAAALKGLERERFDLIAGELEERISKSGIPLPPLGEAPVEIEVYETGPIDPGEPIYKGPVPTDDAESIVMLEEGSTEINEEFVRQLLGDDLIAPDDAARE